MEETYLLRIVMSDSESISYKNVQQVLPLAKTVA